MQTQLITNSHNPFSYWKKGKEIAKIAMPYFPVVGLLFYGAYRRTQSRHITNLKKEIAELKVKPSNEVPLISIDIELDEKYPDPSPQSIVKDEILARQEMLKKAEIMEEISYQHLKTSFFSTFYGVVFGALIVAIVQSTK